MTDANHRGSIGAALAVLAVLVLGGCSTNTVDLTYDTTAVASRPAVAANSVKILSVSDSRKHGSHWLGAIRGPFGSPLKTLNTPVPVKDVVENAFTTALKARGLLASTGGDYGMEVVINQLDSNQLVRREAHIRLHISMVEFASGQQIYATDIRIDKVSGSLVTFDASIFAAVEDLRKVANQALQEAVDQALDDPQLNETLMAGA
jgi:uncharacterized lipoprotein YajG